MKPCEHPSSPVVSRVETFYDSSQMSIADSATTRDVVVFLNRGTPNVDPNDYNPDYKDPQKGTPCFLKTPCVSETVLWAIIIAGLQKA